MVIVEMKVRERGVTRKIAKRAVEMAAKHGRTLDPIDVAMDITATHRNGNPLRLRDLLEADDFNFAHDVFGIERKLDRSTGKLVGGFLPRFSQRQR